MSIAMQLQTVGEIVRLLRARRQLEQVELANACGWRDASAVSRIETDRISPTRRTLVKLADCLADEHTTGTADEVRGWLFLAAGILPTKDDVARASSALPAIEAWNQPALVLDFGWFVWRANPLFTQWLNFPPAYEGTNLLQIVFSDAVREHLGPIWDAAARETVRQFRGETAHRGKQRWYRKLLEGLSNDPAFTRVWSGVVPPEPRRIHLRTRESPTMGSVSIIRLTLPGEPRLSLAQIVPEDPRGKQVLADIAAGTLSLAAGRDIR